MGYSSVHLFSGCPTYLHYTNTGIKISCSILSNSQRNDNNSNWHYHVLYFEGTHLIGEKEYVARLEHLTGIHWVTDCAIVL